jgi:CDP-glucose 4,6-dehydratase
MEEMGLKMALHPEFWRGKRVFVTGHTGFKGSWMSLWLQHLGAEVTGYALTPPTHPSLFEEARIAEGMTSIEGNICDLGLFRQSMQIARPEIVIHMAAQPLVRYSYQNPVETFDTNVMGTVHMLEVVRATSSVRAIVSITTDKCYENHGWVWGYRENDPMGGYDPYSSSKGCAELVSAAYRSSFFNARDYANHGVGLATARAGNVIGGGDWAKDRLIPDIIAAFEQGKPVHIRSPHAIRPWQHVLEPLRGYLMLAEKLVQEGPAFAEGWNFGPSDEDAKSVGWIVEEMAKCWGDDAQWQIDEGEHPHEDGYIKLYISKARNRLDWNPALRLGDALNLSVDWARKRNNRADMRLITQQQISAYQNLAQAQ